MPLLKEENPKLAENLSATALRLRQDENVLDAMAEATTDVQLLKNLSAPLQNRALGKLLISFGVKEPEAEHIALAEKLVFSEKPSAQAAFPGGVLLERCYEDCPLRFIAIGHPMVSQ